jgi:hypothetical protein
VDSREEQREKEQLPRFDRLAICQPTLPESGTPSILDRPVANHPAHRQVAAPRLGIVHVIVAGNPAKHRLLNRNYPVYCDGRDTAMSCLPLQP